MRGLDLSALALAAYVLATAVLVGAIVQVNAGQFSYTLDDPYIHLELARHFGLGEHGVNPGELSAPSSSILWPVLLVPAWWLPGTFYAPLIACALASVLAIAGFGAALHRVIGDHGLRSQARWLAVGLVVIGNLAALTLAGMEHAAHVAVTVWVVVGALDVAAGRPTPRWLVPAIVLMPALRLEGLGLAGLLSLWLILRGRRAAGLVAGTASLGLVVGYLAWLHARTGFWLPFSILSKRAMFSPAYTQVWLPGVFLPLALALVVAVRAWKRGPERELPLIALAAFLGHLVFGQTGLFFRYMGYVTVLVVLVALWSERELVRDWLRAGGEKARYLAWGTVLLAVVNLKGTWDSVGAGAHIWRMQGQLARIAAEVVDGPVAVNDLGWVTLGSDRYVVDLAGLASPVALRHLIDGDTDPAWMDTLVQEHGARLVMIFPHWFKAVPEGWTPVARLTVERSSFAPQDRVVRMYATSPAEVDALVAGLRAFRGSLPEGVKLAVLGDAAPSQ